MSDLDKNYKYFKDNYDELKKQYVNKYVVIVDEKVIQSCNDLNEAVEYVKHLEPGKYIVQKVAENPEDLIQTFHSRVRF